MIPAVRELIQACLDAPGPDTATSLEAAARADGFSWPELLAEAITGKILPLVADTLAAHDLADLPPAPLARHLDRTRRASEHSTLILRAAAADIARECADAGIPIVFVKGIAVECELYGGRGARQFGDLDALTLPVHRPLLADVLRDAGFIPGHYDGRPGTDDDLFHRPTGDLLTPAVLVDVATTAADQILAEARLIAIPGHDDAQLPVPTTVDQLCITATAAARRPLRPHLHADIARLRQARG